MLNFENTDLRDEDWFIREIEENKEEWHHGFHASVLITCKQNHVFCFKQLSLVTYAQNKVCIYKCLQHLLISMNC